MINKIVFHLRMDMNGKENKSVSHSFGKSNTYPYTPFFYGTPKDGVETVT